MFPHVPTPPDASGTVGDMAGAEGRTLQSASPVVPPPPDPVTHTGGEGQSAVTRSTPPSEEKEKIYQWIKDLGVESKREDALLELSKRREAVEDLSVWLWYSFGTVAALLHEVINIYPSINPPTLTAIQSNRVCNALALMQCLASHQETRRPFLEAHIPLFLYPFLHTTSKSRPFEYLRLTSLGVIGALVKTDEPDVISFLLSTEIIPLCLRIMENGTELSRTVATFILQKILLDQAGLGYICQTFERFSQVASVLKNMVESLAKDPKPSDRLLKHVIRCYSRLSENNRARDQMKNQMIPAQLKDGTFAEYIENNKHMQHWLNILHKNVNEALEADAAARSLIQPSSATAAAPSQLPPPHP